MKRILYLMMLILPLLCSCSSEEETSRLSRTRTMVFDGDICGFEPETRAAAILTFNEGDVMYLELGGIKAKAEYSGGKWTVDVPESLSDGESGTCTAYYIENGSLSGTSVSLSTSSVIYKGTGTFSNTTTELRVSSSVSPLTARVHFRGAVGTQITVTGMQTYSAFNTSTYVISSSTSAKSLTVQSDGYTPYVYALLSGDRTLKIQNGAYTYSCTFGSSVMRVGSSGYIDIPTQASHDKWTTNESTNIDVSGFDYGNDSDWNQEEPKPSENVDVSGSDYGSDEDWNQKDVVTHEYVDLGLSVKWATCNVGASKPEEYGEYFAWAAAKSQYLHNWVNTPYQTQNTTHYSNTKFTKYLGSDSSSYRDSSTSLENALKTILDIDDDVAHICWGGQWRMPTDSEMKELIINCTWTWTNYNGVYGDKVTSKINGNFIFLPAAGFIDYSFSPVSWGRYWSSSLNVSIPYEALGLFFSSNDVDFYGNYRYSGFSVRAVFP